MCYVLPYAVLCASLCRTTVPLCVTLCGVMRRPMQCYVLPYAALCASLWSAMRHPKQGTIHAASKLDIGCGGGIVTMANQLQINLC